MKLKIIDNEKLKKIAKRLNKIAKNDYCSFRIEYRFSHGKLHAIEYYLAIAIDNDIVIADGKSVSETFKTLKEDVKKLRRLNHD